MQPVTKAQYKAAGVTPVCGFEFKYRPDQPSYGVGVVTDGTIPQLTNMEEALRVGKALQLHIFGTPVEQESLLHSQ